MLGNTQSIACAFCLASDVPRSPYRHLELCGVAFFFSDGAPTAMLAVFNAVTVGIGELISCTILGVALVKLIESNAGLNKIFTEE